eukprot:CAMPEP_0180249734 /NCGR_PEP_ID=MMETSP0987-20121128/37475_1 /TAXON_ID=697907 /ORGANISM="non described non described, Strain CCMP2293" /LENGTH=256 /DNA_ID=CAMNT_0022218055 /DNA_START=38 /DNA_END=805 /DNA_ORIENTATION=+
MTARWLPGKVTHAQDPSAAVRKESLVMGVEEEDGSDAEVDIVGEGEEATFSDDSDTLEPNLRMPRKTRYDVGFIFELLWRSRGADPNGPRICIPETIVFRNNQPTGWYFTHDGRIMKRSLGQEHFITNKKILEVFGGSTGEVVATFIKTIDLDGKRVVVGQQYFDRFDLRDFLYRPDPTRCGFLQRFVSIRKQRYGTAAQTNQTLQTLKVRRGQIHDSTVEQQVHFLRMVNLDTGETHAVREMRSSIQLHIQGAIF